MKLPEEINFGFYEIKITYDRKVARARATNSEYLPAISEIRVQSSLHIEAQKATLFRMIFHLVEDGAILSYDNHVERQLSDSFFTALRDNPGLIGEFEVDEIKTLRLFGQTWAVEVIDEHIEHSGQAWGDELTLSINAGVPEGTHRHTVFHELLHVCYQHLSLENNEDEIDRMAWMLALLWFQNDMSWLKEEEVEEPPVLIS